MRTLLSDPAFTAIVVLTLALSIGANTAVFSVVNAVLLRPLPLPAPEQLATLRQENVQQRIHEGLTSIPNFMDWRSQNHAFTDMAAYVRSSFTLTGTDEPEIVLGAMVSVNFVSLVGVSPILGRSFLEEEEQPGRDQVVLLGYGLWQRCFGAQPEIMGKAIQLGRESRTVIGVIPPGFAFPEKAEFWVPLMVNARRRIMFRNHQWLTVIGRLKPGITLSSAQAEMDTIASRLSAAYPQDNAGWGIHVVSLHEQQVKGVRQHLLLLWLAVAGVLLIACAGVAHLLLTRATRRQKEIAIRAALGAGRFAIVHQLFSESLVLSGASWAAGLLLARWGLNLLVALSPSDIPRLNQSTIDARVLGFTGLISLLTALGIGLAPVLQASRLDINSTLKGQDGTGRPGGMRFRKALIVSQTALTLGLLIAAGLLIKSFWKLRQVDPGFNPDRLLTVRLKIPDSKYATGPAMVNFVKGLEERVRTLPGVLVVGATSNVLLDKFGKQTLSVPISVENVPAEPGAQRFKVPVDVVTPDYFRTMGIPIVSGRAFTERDTDGAALVAIINEALACYYWPDSNPVGKRFKFADPNFKSPWFTIVGVVREARRQGLDAPINMEVYLPYSQAPSSSAELVIRVASDPATLIPTIRAALRTLEKDLIIVNARTLDKVLEGMLSQRRFTMLLLCLFAGTALFLAVVGTYGVVSYSVTLRTHEIGIRMALGAGTRDILKLVVRHGMTSVLIGLLMGLLAALALTRVMSNLLFGITATDPFTLVGACLLLALAALLACFIPARRASKIDPMMALRYE